MHLCNSPATYPRVQSSSLDMYLRFPTAFPCDHAMLRAWFFMNTIPKRKIKLELSVRLLHVDLSRMIIAGKA